MQVDKNLNLANRSLRTTAVVADVCSQGFDLRFSGVQGEGGVVEGAEEEEGGENGWERGGGRRI